MKLNIYIAFIGLSILGQVYAQERLTVKEAVEIALSNNYDIKLAKNNETIAKENTTYGNAGMLPSVTGNFSRNKTVQNSRQVQSTGEERSLDNAKNNNMSYGVSLGWTIFDGLGMFARYDALKEWQKLGEVEVKRMIVNQVSDVMTTYYSIVEQQNILGAMDSSIVISKERLRTAENRFSIGKASRLEVLNVQVNLNSDESARIKQQQAVNNLKIVLNSLLARDVSIDFTVEDVIKVNQDIILGDLLDKSKRHNPDLLARSINKRIAELELKNVKASRYPTVRLNGGYNIAETESSLGFVTQSNSKGLNYGLTASVNLFDGFNQRRNERVAKMKISDADLEIDKAVLQIETSLTQAYLNYQTNLALVKLESKNEQIAKQNLSITLDKYKIGTISSVEFRDAQENYINAVARNSAALVQAKLSETLLKELVGEIDLILE